MAYQDDAQLYDCLRILFERVEADYTSKRQTHCSRQSCAFALTSLNLSCRVDVERTQTAVTNRIRPFHLTNPTLTSK